jgi:hypothetical protein
VVANIDVRFARSFRFAAHVDGRRGVVTDEDDRDARRDVARAQCGRGRRDFAAHGCRHCLAVDQLTDHEALAAAFELLLPPPVVLPPPLLPELELPELELPELELLLESLDEDDEDDELSLLVVEAAGVDEVDALSELPGLLDE